MHLIILSQRGEHTTKLRIEKIAVSFYKHGKGIVLAAYYIKKASTR